MMTLGFILRTGVCCVLATTYLATAHAENDALCDALRVFAESVDDAGSREVFLLTDWGAEPTIACGRSEHPSEIAFCARLVESASIEFMAINVQRVLECVGVDFPGRDEFAIRKLSGTVVTHAPAFTDVAIDMVVTFDTTGDDGLPSLRITMRKPAVD